MKYEYTLLHLASVEKDDENLCSSFKSAQISYTASTGYERGIKNLPVIALTVSLEAYSCIV